MIGVSTFRRTPVIVPAGVRRLDVRRDLAQVADLLDIAFREEKGDSPVPLHSSFSAMRSLAPAFWLLSPVFPSLANMFTGFVWSEDNRILGNVNVSRMEHQHDLWLIGNVAVHPLAQRRGIARRLTRAGLEHAQRHGARTVVLDVREDNNRAMGLYDRLGFRTVGAIRELYLPARALRRGGIWRDTDVALPDGLRLDSQVPAADVWAMVLEQHDSVARRLRTIRERDYLRGPLARASAWLTGPVFGQSRCSLGLRDSDGHLVAWAGVDSAPSRLANRLRLRVRDQLRGSVERVLIAGVLDRLEAVPAMDVWAHLDAPEVAAADELMRSGFRRIETLQRQAVELAREV